MPPPAYIGEGGNMQSSCDVCPFVCQSVITEQEPIVTWALPVGSIYLEAQAGRGSKKFMNCILALWPSTPDPTPIYPKIYTMSKNYP